MTTMVMCPDNAPSSAIFQRYPSPPVSYPFNNVTYNTPGNSHPQDYNQFPDPSVQQAWYSAMYGSRPEDWNYPAATSGTMTTTPAGPYGYRSVNMGIDYSQPQGPMSTSESPGESSSSGSSSGSPSNKQLRPPYDWMKKATYQAAPSSGKTRTKDKYRVVYSDHQRLELEKEFHYSRYITIRRKAELAQNLALSERQVKIWFQNRRAKERKLNKKRDDNMMKINPDLGELSDENKQHVQQQMNMQMMTHAQNQVQVQSPSPSPVHAQHQYGQIPVGPHHAQHLSPPNVMSQSHVNVHGYTSPNHILSPVSGQEALPCSVSPVTIKTDLDAQDNTV